jgi:broad specificity phosphatase PhoE
MSLTLLRHEARPMDDPRFFTSLTTEGFDRSSSSLIDRLYFSGSYIEPIDVIYCSPFLRTVQTVVPFARTTGLKIRIEPALYEFMENPLFTSENWCHTWEELPTEWKTYIDTSYQPVFSESKLKFRETWTDCLDRTKCFLDYLLDPKIGNTHHHPLVVSHMTTINSIQHHWDDSVMPEDDFPIGGAKLIQTSPLNITVTGSQT